MDYRIQVSKRVRELVEGNVITIGVQITQDGIDTWARCTQPHPRLGILTHTSYSLDVIEELLAKVVVRSTQVFGHTVGPTRGNLEESGGAFTRLTGLGSLRKLSERVPSPKDIGFKSREDALAVCAKENYDKVYKGAMMNQLPADSLSPHDLDRSVRVIYARACSIADNVGTARLVSRITSNPQKLKVVGAESISDWWALAEPIQKFMLLTRAKLFSKGGKPALVSDSWLKRIDSTPCPFRDPEAQVDQFEEEPSGKEAEQASDSSTDDLTREISGITIDDW